MDKQEFEKRVEERWGHRGKHSEKGRVSVGVALLVVGGLFLARATGADIPLWIFSWQVFLIGVGLFIGIRHRFRGIGWLFPIAIGGIFLADKLSPEINLRPYFWPILLIAAGLFIIFRPKYSHCHRGRGRDDNSSSSDITSVPTNTDLTNTNSTTGTTTAEETAKWEKAMIEGNDVIDITAIFGGVKKNVLSKNFKGGEIVAVMGGAEVNLTQADFTGKVMIDSFNMFGGTKLIVPPDWEVQSNVVTIFGGVDDKRSPVPSLAPGKVLYLDGTCLFGGLEIRSY
jgi:predicted membrane protein